MNNINFKDRRVISYLVVFSVFLVGAIGATVAYFVTNIQGNDDAKDITVSTANLLLEYIDGKEISMLSAYPGEYVTKTVHVTNKSTKAVAYALGMKEYVNTFINDEFVVSYTCTSYENYGGSSETESGTCQGFPETAMTSESSVIDEGIQIGVGITHEITITFKFKETGSNQNSNQGQTFAGLLNVEESGDAFTLVMQVLDNNNVPVANANVEIHSVLRTGTTNEFGIVSIPNVPVGNHTLTVKKNDQIILSDNFFLTSTYGLSNVSGTTVVGKSGEMELQIEVEKGEETNLSSLSNGNISKMIVNLSEGETIQTFLNWYPIGGTLTLTSPTRFGYIFDGWTVTGGTIENNILTFTEKETKIVAKWVSIPIMISYTGTMGIGSTLSEAKSNTLENSSYQSLSDDWQIYFLTSGTLTVSSVSTNIDLFAVGGGGGGGSHGGGGGAGGYTTTLSNIKLNNQDYIITIGNGGAGGPAGGLNGGSTGGVTSFSEISGASASGGGGGNANFGIGGTGGSGGGAGGGYMENPGWKNPGTGGSDGSSGGSSFKSGGSGQGTTTKAFAESTGELYAGGGGGGNPTTTGGAYGSGGEGGGGNGRNGKNNAGGSSGTVNTGGGGGGGCIYTTSNGAGYSGGSGVIIIRNVRQS